MMHKAWCSIEEVPYCFTRSFIKFKGHKGKKNADFNTNWAFLDCNFSLNSPMALKWCTKLHIVWKRCPIVFQGHSSNFKVTRDKKIAKFDPNRVFLDCNFSFNSPMDLKWCAWCDVEEVPYYFWRLSIKFQGHMGWKIDDLDQIWARLLGRSQLSNPSDLPC